MVERERMRERRREVVGFMVRFVGGRRGVWEESCMVRL